MEDVTRVREHEHDPQGVDVGVAKGDIPGQVTFIASLFGVAA
jgi:hypothetical protein